MIVKVLVENSKRNDDFLCEHGLSLYIETQKHKLLFDTGATNLFESNAKTLGVNLKEIDLLILSHGHYDHGGGLGRFLEINHQAKVYIKEDAFLDYYSEIRDSELKYIGLDKQLKGSQQVVLVKEDLILDEELSLFMNIQGEQYNPTGNKRLFMKQDEAIVNDSFSHEQSLVIHEGDHRILIAGCAHRGIVNIVDHINQRIDRPITHIISGFHMYNHRADKSEDPIIVNNVAKHLQKLGCECYTGHCTGHKAFEELSELLKEKIIKLSTGDTIIIE
jgi:7,8-dihydropterin-6-yl-methyl-4-(beta-D-ribofuranosyl)aminobenzene 5'-phosphate synthase